MEAIKEQSNYFGTERISKILFKMAPPVMLAQLIQALYNIVDSVFVGRFSDSGLTALSIIYPIQLLMIALVVMKKGFHHSPTLEKYPHYVAKIYAHIGT